MAANVSQSEAECTCPVCCDIFKDPVVLLCGHSFCKHCLQEWWRQSRHQACPMCKKIFPMAQPPPNLALRNLSDTLRQEKNKMTPSRPREYCSVHNERLNLFCQDDQQLICVICRDEQKHKKHNCVPINEAAQDHKVSKQYGKHFRNNSPQQINRGDRLFANICTFYLQTNVRVGVMHLKSKLGLFQAEKLKCDKMASHINLQAQRTEKTVREEFQKLYQFLRAEEAARIDAVRREATQKSRAMNIRTVNLRAEISSLTDKITTTEEEMKADDFAFMMNVKTTIKRKSSTLQINPSALTHSASQGHLLDPAAIVKDAFANAVEDTPLQSSLRSSEGDVGDQDFLPRRWSAPLIQTTSLCSMELAMRGEMKSEREKENKTEAEDGEK
ncbi:hypothetical protein INR49_004074, partial [Caranx melampygus]